MADCSNLEEGLYCQKLGFDIVGSTMSGYTGGTVPEEPDYQLVKDLKAAGCRAVTLIVLLKRNAVKSQSIRNSSDLSSYTIRKNLWEFP